MNLARLIRFGAALCCALLLLSGISQASILQPDDHRTQQSELQRLFPVDAGSSSSDSHPDSAPSDPESPTDENDKPSDSASHSSMDGQANFAPGSGATAPGLASAPLVIDTRAICAGFLYQSHTLHWPSSPVGEMLKVPIVNRNQQLLC